MRQLGRINFQMRSETRVGIHIKCFFQILVGTVMHECILLKLAVIKFFENLRRTFRVFYSRGAGVKDTETLIPKLVWRRHKKLTHTHQRFISQNTCFSLCFAWF